MHTQSLDRWRHDHTFGQDARKAGETRTLAVVAISGVTMVAEITAGVAFGSMALLADGVHMGSHTSALLISAFAYRYTRRHAKDERFSFGAGKVNSLAAFASAVLLALFALAMAWESVRRLAAPQAIEFNSAILVAVIGLAVNGVCLLIFLGGAPAAGHHHEPATPDAHGHRGEEPHETPHRHGLRGDHNLWSAYLHVLADALTSVLAVAALLAGKYLDLAWLDPLMGVVGAALVIRWSLTLLRSSGHILLDMQASEGLRAAIRRSIEAHQDNRVSDLHVWAVGPEIYAAELVVVCSDPREADHYRELLPKDIRVVHLTVEVRRCMPPPVEADDHPRGASHGALNPLSTAQPS